MSGPQPVSGHLKRIYLVPVEVFGTDVCWNCMENLKCRRCGEDTSGYGLMDAIGAGSDCNRAEGHIYREWDLDIPPPGGAVAVWVAPGTAL